MTSSASSAVSPRRPSGHLAADYVRARGAWPGPRVGYNLPGMLAWALGSIVGLAPLVGRLAGVSWPWLVSMEPAAVCGFLVAFLTYRVSALLGAESAADETLKLHLLNETPAESIS